MAEASLRIDKYLWFARIARTRAQARQLAESGHVRCDGRRIERAHSVVRVGEVLSVPLASGVRIIRVVSLPSRRVSPKQVESVCETLQPDGHINR